MKFFLDNHDSKWNSKPSLLSGHQKSGTNTNTNNNNQLLSTTINPVGDQQSNHYFNGDNFENFKNHKTLPGKCFFECKKFFKFLKLKAARLF